LPPGLNIHAGRTVWTERLLLRAVSGCLLALLLLPILADRYPDVLACRTLTSWHGPTAPGDQAVLADPPDVCPPLQFDHLADKLPLRQITMHVPSISDRDTLLSLREMPAAVHGKALRGAI